MSTVALWIVAFTGAMAFAFALKTELDSGFLFYTTLFAVCTASVVVYFA